MGNFGNNFGGNYASVLETLPTIDAEKTLSAVLCVNNPVLNDFGSTFQAKLVDCFTRENVNTTTFVEQFIVFYKPDGTRFEKTAILLNFSGELVLSYSNKSPETESILDMIGKWEYAGKVIDDDGDEFESSERAIFWVK